MQRSARRSRWRWLVRGVVALVALVVLAVAAAVIALHTGWGHELLRREVEHQLAGIFTGGASLGEVDGSPFGTLTLRNLVINGPDRQPAISVRTANVELGLRALLSHEARVEAVSLEDVDVALKRDAGGALEVGQLVRPSPPKPTPSAWSVALPSVVIRRAHVAFDTGGEPINLDGVSIDAHAELPSGGPIDATIELHGAWRERAGAGLALQVAVRADQRGISVPSLSLRAGDVSLHGDHVSIARTGDGRAPLIGGAISVNAGAAAFARLVPGVRLPDDVAVTITATPVAPAPGQAPGQARQTQLAITGRLGATPVQLTATADLDARHGHGELSTGTVDLATVSFGKLTGSASLTGTFDVQPAGSHSLPIARASLIGWTTVAGIPKTTFELVVSSDGELAHTTLKATGDGASAALDANVRVTGQAVAIEGATLHVAVSDPARASGGKAAVHGNLEIDLAAKGALRPVPSIALTGTIDGRHLAMTGATAERLHVALDAKRLPDRPYGTAHIELADIVRGDLQLGALTLDATDRADGKIAVTLRSRPKPNPWEIDADVLVTPPGEVRASATGAPEAGRGVVIDILRDRVRAGSGTEWTGHGGHIEIGPERIAIRDFESASSSGHVALAGSYERAGGSAGDLAVNIDAKAVALDDLVRVYRGKLDSKIAVTRRGGVWQGDADVAATGLAIDVSPDAPEATPTALAPAQITAAQPPTATAAQPTAAQPPVRSGAPPPGTKPTSTPTTRGASSIAGMPGAPERQPPPSTTGQPAPGQPAPQAPTSPHAPDAGPALVQAPPPKPPPVTLDARTHISLHGRKLTVTADARSKELGGVKLALDVDTPAAIADPRAWARLGRSAIRTAWVTLDDVDLGRVAAQARLAGDYTGRIAGRVELSSQLIGGHIAATNLVVPRLRGVAGIDVTLDLSQPSATELAPVLTAGIAGVGKITAKAELSIPERLLDPAAWAALDDRMLHGAHIRSDQITVDPGLLDRFGVVSDLRGRFSIAADVGEGGRTLSAKVDVIGLHGKPIYQPIDAHLTASSDNRTMTAGLSLAAAGTPLIDIRGQLPMSAQELVDRMRADPAAARATPLSATAKLASVDAVKLLAMFGRNELVAGRIDGEIELNGTLGEPLASVRLVATGLKTPPGPRGQNVRSLDKLTVTGSWDGAAAKLDVDGAESAGGSLKITAAGSPDAINAATVTVKATKFDLAPILVFIPGPAGGTSGQLDANLTLTGLDLRTTKLTGELHLVDARVPVAPTVGTLREAKIDAVIAGHDIKINAGGKLGAGTMALDGTIALDGASPTGGKAKLTLRKVSPIGSVEPQINADITATLAHSNNQWHADLVVDNGFVSIPDENKGEKLKPAGAPADMTFTNGKRITSRPLAPAAPTNPIFIVKIDLRSTRVESAEFRGLIKGNLEMRVDGQSLGLFGDISTDRGDVDLFGHRYQVERAVVSFDGSFDPLLNLRISHDFADVTTVAEIRGRASKPELNLTSQPGTYSQSELLGFLLGGDPSGDPASASASSQATSVGTSFLANQLGGYVRHALPVSIDVLRYQAATATSSAAVEVGSWITASLFLAYRQHLESRPDENTGEGEIEYWLSRRVMIDGTAGDRGYDGIDLLWRLRY